MVFKLIIYVVIIPTANSFEERYFVKGWILRKMDECF